MKISKAFIKKELRPFLYSTIGIIVLGLSINLISWKFKMVSGGLPGYGLVVNYITDFPLGVFLLISNTIILILQFLIAGKTTGIRGIYGYVLLSIFIEATRKFFNINLAEVEGLKNLSLIALQGFLGGFSIALVVAYDYSFGSYSSIFPIVRKFIDIKAPTLFLLFDALLVVTTTIAFGFEKGYLLLVNAVVFYFSFKLFLRSFKDEIAKGNSIFYLSRIMISHR
ncbi:MAG: YitT family protein [Patescibacteria group bacterium]|nr:YitT family protein [Patescibacteria group bacterium]